MPVDRQRYPQDWEAISRRIRYERAGGQCECSGECGLHPGKRCEEMNGQPARWARGVVVLTVAHLGADKPDGTPGDPHDKMDVRDENLAAMCQRCHLRYDRAEHIANARQTRMRRLDEIQGSLPL